MSAPTYLTSPSYRITPFLYFAIAPTPCHISRSTLMLIPVLIFISAFPPPPPSSSSLQSSHIASHFSHRRHPQTEDNWDDVYMSLELLRTHDCVDLDGGDEEEEDDEEEGGGDGEDQGEGGDAGGDERSRRPMGQECGGDDDDGDYDDFDHGDERAQAEKQVDWKSGQLSSVVGRMADAEKLFDASMEEVRATPPLSMVAWTSPSRVSHGRVVWTHPIFPSSSSSSCPFSDLDACRAARGEG
jgi:hypothetical protein